MLMLMYVSNKNSRFHSYSVTNSILIIPLGIVACTYFPTIFLEIAVLMI